MDLDLAALLFSASAALASLSYCCLPLSHPALVLASLTAFVRHFCTFYGICHNRQQFMSLLISHSLSQLFLNPGICTMLSYPTYKSVYRYTIILLFFFFFLATMANLPLSSNASLFGYEILKCFLIFVLSLEQL